MSIIRKYTLPMERYARKNAPSILTGMGIIGVIGTAVMAVKDTKKAEKLIKDKNRTKILTRGLQLTKTERVIAAAPAYLPTMTTGLATIACIYGANSINKTRQTMLLSAYGYLHQCHTDYKDAVKELYGNEVDEKIQEHIMVKNLPEVKPEQEEIVVYEEYSGTYITTTKEKIQNGLFHANRHFSWAGAMTINDILDCFDSLESTQGDVYGWTLHKHYECGGPLWIDANIKEYKVIDDKQVYVLKWNIAPSIDYVDWSLN